MKEKKRGRGRPPKDASQVRSEAYLVRLGKTEKEAFEQAADLAGVPLSIWIREGLRQIAAKQLQKAARPVAFLESR
jgi:AT hook motif